MHDDAPLDWAGKVTPAIRDAILEFVDSRVPEGGLQVWLTGSRVRGDFRRDSDWDVVAFSLFYRSDPRALFCNPATSSHTIDGGIVELVIAHPDHWNDPGRYMTELRASGVRLR